MAEPEMSSTFPHPNPPSLFVPGKETDFSLVDNNPLTTSNLISAFALFLLLTYLHKILQRNTLVFFPSELL